MCCSFCNPLSPNFELNWPAKFSLNLASFLKNSSTWFMRYINHLMKRNPTIQSFSAIQNISKNSKRKISTSEDTPSIIINCHHQWTKLCGIPLLWLFHRYLSSSTTRNEIDRTWTKMGRWMIQHDDESTLMSPVSSGIHCNWTTKKSYLNLDEILMTKAHHVCWFCEVDSKVGSNHDLRRWTMTTSTISEPVKYFTLLSPHNTLAMICFPFTKWRPIIALTMIAFG